MNKIVIFWQYMKGIKALYLAALLAVGAATVCNFAWPLLVRATVDSIIGSAPLTTWPLTVMLPGLIAGKDFVGKLLVMAFLLVGITILYGLFSFFEGRWTAVTSERLARKLRNALFSRLQYAPFGKQGTLDTGDVVQRCSSDVDTVRRFLSTQLVEIGRVAFMLALAVPILLGLNRVLTVWSFAVMPVILIFSLIFFVKVKQAFQLSDEAEGRLSSVMQENLAGIRVIKAFAREKEEIEKFDGKNAEFRDLTYRLIKLFAFYWSSSDLLALVQSGAVLIAGAFMAVKGTISIGTLVVFITYQGMLLWPIRQLGRILTDMGKALVSVGRINEVMSIPQETLSATGEEPAISGDVVFDHVSFSYDARPDSKSSVAIRPVLSDISFTACSGKMIAILGPTGSGKTTLVSLIPRLYDCTSGVIMIDGRDVRDYDKQWLRRNIGMILQDPFLFSRTIRENIILGRFSPEDSAIVESAKVASVHDVILSFENGYDTEIGERGVTLSGGQKQRVALARTIIRDAPILIFDDASSAIDAETENKIHAALRERSSGKTTFVISHRIQTLRSADCILVLENGTISASGTHEELSNTPGLYKRIWEIQSMSVSPENA